MADGTAADGAGRPDGRALRVTEKKIVAERIVALSLAHPDGLRLPDWTPGAHIDLILPTGLTRQYSLCGDRWDPRRYQVAVLREEAGTGGSAYVHDELRPGGLVGVGGPRNNFALVPSEKYLFIAGGIGITPLLPMIGQASLLGADWTLLYGGRTRASMAFTAELAGYGDRVHIVPRDVHGRLDLPRWLGQPRPGVRVYCCGPAPLLAAVQQFCAEWPEHSLRTERFVPLQVTAPARDQPFQVELRRTGATVTVTPGATVTVTPGTTVLDAVQSAGVSVLSSCRRGLCGTCETGVLAGQPDHRDSLLDDEERMRGDCMFICVSRSRGARLVLDL